MDDEISSCSLRGTLQNVWSMRLDVRFAQRVGSVILGKKLLVHIKSKNSAIDIAYR